MKRKGNIFEQICSMDNLRIAHRKAREDKLFYEEVKMVDKDPDYYLSQIQKMLLDETYEVSPYAISIINDKGKDRELAKLPYFPDRIIQWAIMLQIESTFTSTFCRHTCASIPNRGISKAVVLTKRYLKDREHTKYCLQLDVHKFYPSIDRVILKQMLRKKFKDKRLLRLLDKIIDSSPHETGVPIGSYLSQYLANYYLTYLDHYMKEELHVKYVIRYMDDIVVFHEDKEYLRYVRNVVNKYLIEKLNLTLKPNYQIYPVDSRGVNFVGFRFFHRYTLLRKRTATTLKRKMRKIFKKIKTNNLFNFKEFCSATSYGGWLIQCDGFHLWKKYIKPLNKGILRYYQEVIMKKCNLSEIKKYNRVVRFEKKLEREVIAA